MCSLHSMVEHRSITRRFHVVFCLAVAASSAQLLDICPLSSSVLLFHVNAGRPLSLRPTVVHHKACLVISFWVFLSVWPIQFHLSFCLKIIYLCIDFLQKCLSVKCLFWKQKARFTTKVWQSHASWLNKPN